MPKLPPKNCGPLNPPDAADEDAADPPNGPSEAAALDAAAPPGLEKKDLKL